MRGFFHGPRSSRATGRSTLQWPVYLFNGSQPRCIYCSPRRGMRIFFSWAVSEPFGPRPVVYILIHANSPTISRIVSSYPRSLINVFITAGLLYIHSRPKGVSVLGWDPPFRAYTTAIWVFLASNVFLVVVPWIPPAPGYQVYEHLPYFVSELWAQGLESVHLESLQLITLLPVVALPRGVGDRIYGCRVLVCTSGLSTPPRGIQT